MAKAENEQFSERKTLERREKALKRMLSTPHKPHKPLGKKTISGERLHASAKKENS